MDVKDRLLAHVDRSGPSLIVDGLDLGPCWLWTGRLTDGGYGQFKYQGKACRAHKVAFKEWRGQWPQKRVLMHLCDTRRCVNPDHLKPGSQLQNVRDMMRKGRHYRQRTRNVDELTRHDLTWAAKRLPRALKVIMKREGPRVFVAGGFIRSCVANEPVNDVDVFTSTKEDAERLANELAGANGGTRKPYATDNAYTVRGMRGVAVQFIHRWTFTSPDYAVASFDYTIAKAAIWWHDGKTFDKTVGWRSTCDEAFYADLSAKRLVYTSPLRNEEAGGSILRMLKFYQRGYRIPLDSLGAVIARLCQGVRWDELRARTTGEAGLAKLFTGLLREVDPLVDPDAEGHEDTVDTVCEHGKQTGIPCLACYELELAGFPMATHRPRPDPEEEEQCPI